MADQSPSFADVIAAERTRITKEHEELLDQKSQIDERLAALARELQALDAYDAVKAGRTATVPAAASPAPRAPRTPSPSGGTGARRTGQREAVLAVIEEHPDGIAPGAILVAMHAETDADKTSVRNALSALKKNNSVASRDGKYFPA